ncbi:uncharacterized protein LOC105216511 [Zeugodacus cucurbitae]|uniref:uncharacterized protein LOC105216511 n=1 Tax=Zeugodacus cucurbitae TaxID=28588 RepID=UPI0005968DA6|nr:uncharacterized protein LOC105216511 [Zeugodacus cucurbitae]
MKCFVGLLLLLVLLGVQAYDFDDSAFNEYLFKELQSHYEGEELYTHRTRREATDAKECAKRSWKKDMQCCKNGNVNGDQWELFKSVKKQCIADLKGEPADQAYDPFDCEKMQQVKEQMICITECVAKRFKSLDENGDLQRDAILEGLRGQIGTVQWKLDAIEGYVDKCLAEVKEKREQRQKTGQLKEGSCSRLPIAFHSCMWRQFWNGCPADLRVDSPKCNKMRERVADGDTRFFGKHFLNKYYPSPRDDD